MTTTTSKLGADMLTDEQIERLAQTHLTAGDDGEVFGVVKFARALLARQPAAIGNEAAGYTEQFDVDELKRGGVMRVFAAHETDHDIPVYLTTPLEKESNQPVEPKVTITRQQFDAMRVALEVIAVGDSKTPSDTAAHGLVASGFWTDALETENSNSRAASTSANVAQGAETVATVKVYETYTGQNGWIEVTQEEYDRTKDKYEHRIRRVSAPPAQTALTDEQIVALTKQVTGWTTHFAIPQEPHGHFYAGHHHKASVDEILRLARAALTAAQSASGDMK